MQDKNRLFIGNLSYSIDSKKLAEIFSQFGEVVSAEIVQDKMTGRSRGFGFVAMAQEQDAQKAIEGLNGQEVEGRKMIVNIARPRESRGA